MTMVTRTSEVEKFKKASDLPSGLSAEVALVLPPGYPTARPPSS